MSGACCGLCGGGGVLVTGIGEYPCPECWEKEKSDVQPDSAKLIVQECRELEEMLLEKNRAYGDSALDPVRIFSKASTVEQILVRLDDKLSRLQRGSDAGEDVIKDLLGYLILLRIAQRKAKE